ncbi:MAG: hypothetical protein ACYDA6_01030 [Solirubrobacteraceae bacterium]
MESNLPTARPTASDRTVMGISTILMAPSPEGREEEEPGLDPGPEREEEQGQEEGPREEQEEPREGEEREQQERQEEGPREEHEEPGEREEREQEEREEHEDRPREEHERDESEQGRTTTSSGQMIQEWDYSKWPHTEGAPPDPTDRGGWRDDHEYQELQKAADQAWHEYVEAIERQEEHDPPGTPKNDPVLEEFQRQKEEALRRANEAIDERDAWQPKVS